MLLPLIMVADKAKQVDIPGQAQVENSIRNAESKHGSWIHVGQGYQHVCFFNLICECDQFNPLPCFAE